MRTPRTVIAATAAAAACTGLVGLPGTAVAASDLTVTGGSMTVHVAGTGGIDAVSFADGRTWPLSGRTTLTGDTVTGAADQCTPQGAATATGDGGATWQTHCTDAAGQVTTITDRLTPATNSVAWTVQIQSETGTYAKGIWTDLTGWTDTHTRQFWTTWGQSPYTRGHNPDWSDPLRPAPFTDLDLPYGGNALTGQNGFAIPLATIVEPDTDHGLNLVQSPTDVLLDANLTTSSSGDIGLGRFHNRITPDRPVTFHINLVPTAADWRPGLGWTAHHYPGYFTPVASDVNKLSGLASYSYFPGPFSTDEQARLKSMGYRTNWDATFAWPYMGEFMPPVGSPDETWVPTGYGLHPNAPSTISVNRWRQTMRNWTDAGFHQLAYFNTTEFGTGIGYPRPPQTVACDDPEVWTSPNDQLYCAFPDAMLPGPDDKPIPSWEGAVVMDPGDPAYQQHLLDQARALLTAVPEYDGINIDRLDWLLRYNTHADDGVSWYHGGPARSLITSWKQLQPKLQAIVHGMGKQVWISPTAAKRIDWMHGIDGIFSEYDNGDTAMNLDAFLGLNRPVTGWNYDLRTNPDQFLQRYLYMGVYPMGPAPDNDHGIGESAAIDRAYQDYGPMFRALEGRKWLLTAHAVQVSGADAVANAFTVPDGVVVPVVGNEDESARVTLAGLQRAVPGLDLDRARYLSPGSDQWQPLSVVRGATDTAQVDVPLVRGAALVRFLTYPAETDLPPSVALDSSGRWVAPDSPVTVTATVRNDALTALQDVDGALTVPDGWTVESLDRPVTTLEPGDTARFRWRVSAPGAAGSTVHTIVGEFSYRHGVQDGKVSQYVRLATGVPPSVTPGRVDDTTQGDWKGRYGTEGYFVADDSQSWPDGVQVDLSDAGRPYTWNADTSEPRALLRADSAGRIASCRFGTDFSFTVDTTDGATHQFAVYLLDWDYATNQAPREETLTVTDAFGDVLDQVNPGFFGNGKYVVWNVRGQVTVDVHMIFGGNDVGGNAVVSGVFADPAA